MHRLRLILLALVALLAVGCPRAPVQGPVAPPAVHVMLGTGGADPYAFFANMRATKQFYVTDPTMAGGAKGDNTTDDTAAIVAADGAAKAVGGTVVFPNPTTCYKTTAEIGVHWIAHWQGFAQSVNQPTICAHGSGLRSVIELRSTFGEGSGGTPGFLDNAPTRALLENLTIDAGSGAAEVGLLLDGAADSRLVNLHVINATEYAIRNAAVILPATISGTTQGGTGGSPTGATFTQSDANFLNGTVFGIAGGASPLTLVVKIFASGALGTATYVLSVDGGSTFSTLAFPLVATFNLTKSDASHYQGPLGITGHFAAGTYNVGTTYSVTVTPTNADIAQPEADNTLVIYDTLVIAQSGTIYATPATFLGQYNGFTFTVSASGTAGTTTGSQIVTGSGTSWLSQIGCDYGRGVVRVGGTFYEIASVLDDTHLVIVSSPLPTATASGLEWAMSCGAGFYEDGTNENNYTRWIDGDIGQVSIGMMLAAARGMTIDGVHVNSSGLAGIVEGASTDSSVQGALLNKVHTASGSFGSHGVPYLISPNSSGAMNEPQGVFVVGGDPGSWFLRGSGSDSPLVNNFAGTPSFGFAQSYVPFFVQKWIKSAQTLSSPSQQIALPDYTPFQNTGNTSFRQICATSDMTMTSAPLIVANNALTPGTLLILESVCAPTITIVNDIDSGSGIHLEAQKITLNYEDTLMIVSGGPRPLLEPWVQVAPVFHGYGSQVGQHAGNSGLGTYGVQTTNATPVNLYCLTTGAAGITPGTVVKFDVAAQSNVGTNVASWLDYQLSYAGSAQIAFVAGTASGNGAGSLPPLGWTIGISGTAPACIQAIGDASGTPVFWSINVTHRDTGI